jgi:hypothetical protein
MWPVFFCFAFMLVVVAASDVVVPVRDKNADPGNTLRHTLPARATAAAE